MKIVSLETFSVAVPPPHVGGMYWLFVKLRTDDGIEGVGEIYAATFHPDAMIPVIEDVFERHLLDHDPHHVERFFRACYSSGFTQRPDLTMMGVASGLEMACWDIIGKAAGKPVYELLGGKVNERLRSYTYLYPKNAKGEYDYDDPDLAAECAAENVKLGFTAVKFDPAGPYTNYSGHQLSLPVLDRCETFCRKIREAVGSQADLLFGTHGQMVPSSAIRLARRLEKYDPLWFEEPVPPGQEEAIAEVARHTSIPIATGERLTTKYEFHKLLQAGGASILQMNVGRVGGLLEAKKIATLAEVHYAQIAPHLYNGPVGAAASIQLAACTPNFLIQESIMTWGGFHSEVVKTPIRWEDGYIIPSSEPGLGIELDMDVVRAHTPYTGKRLHLQMADKPADVKDYSPAKG
ncbi:mandelate racemase/muconate lactonizing enzyme family protein [Burkholderia gladioli]|uniref:mandelate racemase/muconate lactonizing enzyme family protein n=1 Tax=Burkholderia gladioli TaxID=28095 RepID=UPI001641589C|nr:mandelate racemase/muconate lactonizing enzyme family protein [Burkholderia gladioli]MBU9270739.1 mandelate racemase/muconate lactonizing enzyme family protein [Burkholderia gladioli]URV26836.1 mandelate racemase/muconate lactonizing enzyme family protein [Burkholderia gladioli]